MIILPGGTRSRSVFANLVMGWPLVLPFALMEGVPGCAGSRFLSLWAETWGGFGQKSMGDLQDPIHGVNVP